MASLEPTSTLQKPLPAIPLRQNVRPLTTLTLNADSHLRKFIESSLKEDAYLSRLEDADSRRDLWVSAIAGALGDLGDRIDRGGWLAGIRRASKARRARQTEQRKRAQRERDEKAEADEKASKEGDAKDQDKGRRSGKQSQGTDKELPGPPAHSNASQESLQDADHRALAWKQLQELASKPVHSRPKPSSKHLLLTIVPFGVRPLIPAEDMGFDLVPSNIGCVFSADVFSLPSSASDPAVDERHVLYGLEEWDVETNNPDEDQLRLVGGAFCFKGVNSREEHEALSRILRLALFMHLSLILEQHLLADSHVRLEFPKAQLSPAIPRPASPGIPMNRQPTVPSVPKRGHRYRESLPTSPSGLWTFVSKKTENLLHRAANVRPHISVARHESLDLPKTVFEGQQLPRATQEPSPVNRIRRFSLFGADGPPAPPKNQDNVPENPFSTAVNRLQAVNGLLSTSPGVHLPVPRLLTCLAEKEEQDSMRKLTGEERAGLNSLLVWEGKEPTSKGFRIVSGLDLFVRQQDFSALYSEHVPTLAPLQGNRVSSSSSILLQEASISGSSKESTTLVDPPAPQFAQCGERQWSTFVFNDWTNTSCTSDKRLGEVVEEFTSCADEKCPRPGCTFKRGDHERRWIHNGTRVRAEVDSLESGQDKKDADEKDIRMWLSCVSCGKKSAKEKISDGTYLLSFAKFLELLIYSPSICAPTPPICEHTTPQAKSQGLPASRLNIVRHFSHKSHVVSFSLSVIEEIYELRLPRLQIMKGHGEKDERKSIEAPRKSNFDDEKKALRKEIMGWWQDVAEHMDRLEDVFGDARNTLTHKTLPRLPSADDAYDDNSLESTPKPKDVPLPPVSSSSSTIPIDSSSDSNLATSRPLFVRAKTSLSALQEAQEAQQENDVDCIQKLSALRHTFQRTEQSLYDELLKTPTSSLNDVRRSFHSAARGAARRLAAWERKHRVSTVDGEPAADKFCPSEPEWWASGCHAIPGGSVIVRENDWGSIIAFTLSSVDYKKELANLSVDRPLSGSPPSHELLPSTPPSHSSTSGSSFFAPGGYKLFKPSSTLQPDPDDEGIVWHEPESHVATITRKEHPRDTTGILSLPSVLRHKSGDVQGLSPSRLANLVLQARSASSSEHTPPSAYAKPDVQLNIQPVDGLVSGLPEAAQVVDKILHEVDAAALESPTRSLSDSMNSNSSGFVESHARRADTASLASTDSGSTVGPHELDGEKRQSPVPPPLPPKHAQSSSASLTPSSSSTTSSRPTSPKPGASSFFSSTLTSGIANAMRLVLNPSETIKSSPAQKTHHALLNVDSLPIDDRPHIKYDWTIGKRLKFSCTVYYAKQFDGLRKRCGIEDVFLKSLEHSTNWAAEGGKSKSNFWKTKDDRFIVKTLVNAWNVGDLQVLIELAPSYLRYMDSTATKPTALAKVLGFYTVEIRNLENGTTQAKADLLVMENLFYDQKITKTFDLKGIHGRKVKPSNNGSSIAAPRTLFDGEWIEGQQRALILLRPYSKLVLQEAVRSDSDFLSKSSIMDYSLLLGLDEGRKQIVCGLVDMIGSYTFAKTLEYKIKQGLNPLGKEVTVMPPNEYQERFVNAMDSYFLACPDKWSRPWDEMNIRLPTDAWDLRCPL